MKEFIMIIYRLSYCTHITNKKCCLTVFVVYALSLHIVNAV